MCSSSWYDAFYEAVEKSKAYAAYCVKAFGYDFSQQGFSDLRQIGFMLDKVHLRPGQKVLDIGCGNGKMVEYIADVCGVSGDGFDISAVAIEAARRRTAGKEDKLTFHAGSINEMQYGEESFDAVLSVDTLYFADDMKGIIREILHWLRPGGYFAAFFSEFRFTKDDPLEKLTPDGTGLARALKEEQIPYDVYSFTEGHYGVMQRKRKVLSGMRHAFEAEGTEMLYDNAFVESIDKYMRFEEFQGFSARFLYVVKKA